MSTCCIVVIGHVDHGKTTLLQALTGTDTDRLPEEKKRGLSIVPGFAHLASPSGVIDFVDAPGHADFIQAMVQGAAGARAALLVISATEGISAQTFEHLNIAHLLGIRQGVIAMTKADLLEPAQHAQRLDEIREGLSGTALAKAPMILCSAKSGFGLKQLTAELDKLVRLPAEVPAPLDSFMSIDRTFSLPGRGTIVTGTLLGDDLCLEDAVTLQPQGTKVSLRGLQSRETPMERIPAGTRMAANLRGVAVEDVPRGSALCKGATAKATQVMDAMLTPLEGVSTAKHLSDVRVLFGTSSSVAQLRYFGDPKTSRFLQLRFNHPVAGFPGQRGVIRRLSPPQTIGGVVLLDPEAAPTRPSDQNRLRLLKAVETGDHLEVLAALGHLSGGAIPLSQAARLLRMPPAAMLARTVDSHVEIANDLIAAQSNVVAVYDEVRERLATYHARYPIHICAPDAVIEPTNAATRLTQHVLEQLVASDQIRRCKDGLALTSHDPFALLTPELRTRMAQLATAFERAKLSPLKQEDVCTEAQDDELIALLLAKETLVALRNVALNQTLVLHAGTIAKAATLLAAAFPAQTAFTPSEARTVLRTSRRVIMPLLEHFDAQEITTRTGNTRTLCAQIPVPPAPAP